MIFSMKPVLKVLKIVKDNNNNNNNNNNNILSTIFLTTPNFNFFLYFIHILFHAYLFMIYRE